MGILPTCTYLIGPGIADDCELSLGCWNLNPPLSHRSSTPPHPIHCVPHPSIRGGGPPPPPPHTPQPQGQRDRAARREQDPPPISTVTLSVRTCMAQCLLRERTQDNMQQSALHWPHLGAELRSLGCQTGQLSALPPL